MLFNLPIIGWPKGDELWFCGWKYTILPTLAGAESYLAYYTRLMKTSMIDSINQDYTLTARAKGLSELAIVKRHVFRNSCWCIRNNIRVLLIINIKNKGELAFIDQWKEKYNILSYKSVLIYVSSFITLYGGIIEWLIINFKYM